MVAGEQRTGPPGRVREAARRVAERYGGFRASVARHRGVDMVFKVLVGLLGSVVMVVGVIALPAPGPGWAIIFLGLGILATEFTAARTVLRLARRRYEAWVTWLARQTTPVRAAVSLGVLLLVAACGWLVGAFAIVGGWLGLEWLWLRSPLRDLLPA